MSSQSTKITRNCQTCGKEFLVEKRVVARGHGKFCSRDCDHKDKTKKIPRICQVCGKEFFSVASQIVLGKALYCSNACRGQGMTKPDPFWSVFKVVDGDHWDWTGTFTKSGYGTLSVQGKPWRAHRYSWVIHFGPIPEGMCVCHRCNRPKCVNPDHLYIDTNEGNTEYRHQQGRDAKGDHNGARTHPEKWHRGDEHFSHVKPELVGRGEQIGTSKLKEADVLEIISLIREGKLSQPKIGARFGVVQGVVSGIKLGKTWKHLSRSDDGRPVCARLIDDIDNNLRENHGQIALHLPPDA